MYADDIVVRYVDDENDEIGISSQADLYHAYQVSFIFTLLFHPFILFLSQLAT